MASTPPIFDPVQRVLRLLTLDCLLYEDMPSAAAPQTAARLADHSYSPLHRRTKEELPLKLEFAKIFPPAAAGNHCASGDGGSGASTGLVATDAGKWQLKKPKQSTSRANSGWATRST